MKQNEKKKSFWLDSSLHCNKSNLLDPDEC